MEFSNSKLKDAHVYDAADTVFKYYGFSDGNPWNTSVQFKNNTIKRDTFSTNTGFTATYFFNIKEDIDLKNLKAVVESANLYHVFINDSEIKPIPGKWWLDKGFGVFNIEQFVHVGKNKISITAKPFSVHAEIEPVYILENFALSSAEKGWDIIKAKPLQIGSCKNQGMQMYGNEVVYTKKININKNTSQKYFVELGKWNGTVATVFVNKKQAGIISLEPYSCDINKYLKNGENEIEVHIIGSLKNTLGPHHNNHAPGLVSPWHWRYVKNYPSGKDYDVYDYGLMEDFKIIQQ